jgi:hypothetical protein
MRSILAVVLVLLLARGAEAQEGVAPVGSLTAAQVMKSLSGELAKDGSFKGLEIASDSREGPLGTTIVRAFAKGAYPGSGVRAVLLEAREGVTYGRHGQKDLAVLVHAQKAGTPDLLKLVSVAFFEGLLMVDEAARPPSLAQKDGAVVLRFVRRSFPSNAADLVTVTFAEAGKTTIASEPFGK